MNADALKAQAAHEALSMIEDDMVVGVGTGSTVNHFITALASIKHRIEATVASSKATEARLKALGIPVLDLNVVPAVDMYIDGADEVNEYREMIKGGGGALTREKLIATVAKRFICIVDESKVVKRLGKFPIAVEVLPMARSYVARELVKLGASPQYRDDFVTDNGNIILDTFSLSLDKPITVENTLKQLTGVVESGVFAKRIADCVLVAERGGNRRLGYV